MGAVSRRRILHVALWIAASVLIVRFVFVSVRGLAVERVDFADYYTASRVLAEGASAARSYDPAWFTAQERRLTPNTFGNCILPPPASFVLLPIALRPYSQARAIWLGVNLLTMVGIMAFFAKTLGLRGPALAVYLSIVMLFAPLQANLIEGQYYVLLLGLVSVAWHGYRQRKSREYGIALGLMMSIKLFGGVLWMPAIMNRSWRTIIWACGTIVFLIAIPLHWIGIDAWVEHIYALTGWLSRHFESTTDFQSQAGFIRHLLIFDSELNRHPLVNAPVAAAILVWISGVGLILASWWLTRNRENPDGTFAAFVVASSILTPVTLEYHYTTLLLPIAIITVWIARDKNKWTIGILVIGLVLVGVGRLRLLERHSTGFESLVAYPRLYGAYLLWFLAVLASRERCMNLAAQTKPLDGVPGKCIGGDSGASLKPAVATAPLKHFGK